MVSDSSQKTELVKERPLTPKSDEEHRHDTALFLENISLILSNQERIVNTPEFFNVRFKEAHFGAVHIGVEWYLPSGVLILLWRKGEWVKTCPKCGGIVYVYRALGSPFSGTALWKGVCASCGNTLSEQDNTFPSLFKPAFEMRDKYMNRIRILKTRGQKFSWSEGLKGKPVEDIVVDKGKEAVEMVELLDLLKKTP